MCPASSPARSPTSDLPSCRALLPLARLTAPRPSSAGVDGPAWRVTPQRLGREYEKLRLADTAAQVVQRGPGCGGGMEDRESIAETGGVDASELLQDADDGVALGLNTVE